MIGAFARILGQRDRLLTLEETGDHSYAVKTRTPEGDVAQEGRDAPPENFVERYPHDGGDVFFAPLVETLRAVLRRPRKEADTDPTLPRLPHNGE